MPYDSPGYQMTFDFGQDHVHVKPSLFQERKKDLKTKDICGPSSQNSLTSAGLQLSLENRLKRQLNTDGSILFKMTWKDAATPAHRRYCLLRALARRTFDTACSGGGYPWPTPVNSEHKGNRTWKDKGQNHLLAHVIKGIAAPNNWRTPTVSDAEGGIPRVAYERRLKDFPSTVKNSYLAVSTFGAALSGGSAKMEKSALLNPGLSRWLMGFPPEWDVCAVTAMQLFPK